MEGSISELVTDLGNLMSASFDDLTRIYHIESETDDEVAWAAKSFQHREGQQSALRHLETQSLTHNVLSQSKLAILKDFTAESKALVLLPETWDRLAGVLGRALNALAGPKCLDLKVRDPEKYKFNPRQLLHDVLQVYLNLHAQLDFTVAVARDETDCGELLKRAVNIAQRRSLKTEPELQQLLGFAARVDEEKELLGATVDDLGDIPHQFLDPLTGNVMHDPAMLPSSKKIVDRSTTLSQLVSTRKDPFDGTELSIEDVTPDLVLKSQIRDFLIERQKNRMDTSE